MPHKLQERMFHEMEDKEIFKQAQKYAPIFKEMARRFRYEKETIRQICEELKSLPGKPTEDDFIAACRAELSSDVGELAAYVEPRFIDDLTAN